MTPMNQETGEKNSRELRGLREWAHQRFLDAPIRVIRVIRGYFSHPSPAIAPTPHAYAHPHLRASVPVASVDTRPESRPSHPVSRPKEPLPYSRTRPPQPHRGAQTP